MPEDIFEESIREAPIPVEPTEQASFTTEAELRSAFKGTITSVRSPFLYKFGLLFVAMAMLLLPMFYVLLIAVVGFALFLHATLNFWVIEAGLNLITLTVYGLPIAAGALLIGFMLKPLFARSRHQTEPLYLTPTQHPLVFSFVEEVCSQVGAPAPRRIDVDCEVNASAEFRRGLVSFFSNDLVLTIGLPLAASMNLRQLAGVLAHELGHFGQGWAMRLTYVIDGVNKWFARVVYQRDEWDVKLGEMSKRKMWYLQLMILISRMFIWITRKILWVLMMFGHMISCFMSRQMELDADRYQARIAGTDAIEPLMKRFALLEAVWQQAKYNLQYTWREQTLVDDIPGLIVVREHMIPSDMKRDIEEKALEQEAGLFDTHPAMSARIVNAREDDALGIFMLSKPTACLFPDFKDLCRKATWIHYRYVIGLDVKPSMLVPLAEYVEKTREIEEKIEAQARYFLGIISNYFPLRFDVEHIVPPADPLETARALKEARNGMLRHYELTGLALNEYKDAFAEYREALQAKAFIQLGYRIDHKDFELERGTLEAAESASIRAIEKKRNASIRLESFAADAKARFVSALRLLYHPQVAELMEDGEVWQERVDPLFHILVQLGHIMPLVEKLEEQNVVLYGLIFSRDDEVENNRMIRAIDYYCRKMQPQLIHLQQFLEGYEYPYEHAVGKITIAQFAVEKPPLLNRPDEFYYIVRGTLDNIYLLYNRILGDLSTVAEKVEALVDIAVVNPSEE